MGNLERLCRCEKGRVLKFITQKTAKLVFKEAFDTGDMPVEIVERHGWWKVDDFEIIANSIHAMLSANEKLFTKYRSGNINVRGALIGAMMKEPNSHTLDMIIVDNVLDWMLDYEGFEHWNNSDDD